MPSEIVFQCDENIASREIKEDSNITGKLTGRIMPTLLKHCFSAFCIPKVITEWVTLCLNLSDLSGRGVWEALKTDDCISYSSMAVKEQHDQGSLQKEEFVWAHSPESVMAA